MKNVRWSKIIPVVMLVFFLAVGPSWAGIFFQTEQLIRGIPGHHDKTQMVSHYVTETASRTEMDNVVTIMDFNSMTLYHLNPGARTYMETNINEFGQPQGMTGDDAKEFSAMMKQMMADPKVTATGETKTINGYKCQKYLVHFMGNQSEYWVTREIPEYKELETISKKMSAAFANNPMLKHLNFAAFIKEMNGFPVKSITKTMMGGTSISTLKHIEHKKLSKELFEIPKGYTESQKPY